MLRMQPKWQGIKFMQFRSYWVGTAAVMVRKPRFLGFGSVCSEIPFRVWEFVPPQWEMVTGAREVHARLRIWIPQPCGSIPGSSHSIFVQKFNILFGFRNFNISELCTRDLGNEELGAPEVSCFGERNVRTIPHSKPRVNRTPHRRERLFLRKRFSFPKCRNVEIWVFSNVLP